MTDTTIPTLPPEPPRRRSSATRVLVVLTVLALLLAIGSVATLWYVMRHLRHAEVGKGTFLHVPIAGELSDAPAEGGLFQDPEDLPPTVGELAQAIREAADDDRITGLYLDLDVASGGWASYQELRSAVDAFRAAGKPCVAYAASALTNPAYYLASGCGTIGMSPASASFVTGLAVELTYYKGLFDKIGINPEFEHVGDFKSFIEAYERTGPSAPAAEAYDALLDSMYGQLVDGIAQGRGRSPDEIRALIDTPTLTPQVALERGMIDLLAWPDAMRARVHLATDPSWTSKLEEPLTKDEDDEDHAKLTDVDEYVRELRQREDGAGPTVLVVHAQGNIVSGDEGGGLFGGGGLLTDKEYGKWLKHAREDDDVKAVVVRVDSPGGSALASSLMWRDNARLKALGKPLVISMGDYAASGGYMISANGDWIVADPGTLTGSIGVFGGKFDLSGTYAKLGLTQHTFARGKMADMLSFSTGFDDAERAVFREYLQDFYGQFLGIVSEGRHMSREDVDAVAQGRVWTGEQALERKLVDQLGTLEDAVAKAAELAKLDHYSVDHLPRRKTMLEAFLENLDDATQAKATSALAAGLDPAALRELAFLERLAHEGGAAAYLPGQPKVR
jgi:protease-4